MEALIIDGAAAGAIIVLLCTASITQFIRNWLRPYWRVLECPFCTSWWVVLLFDRTLTYLATVFFANVAVMLLHWSVATYQTEEDQT